MRHAEAAGGTYSGPVTPIVADAFVAAVSAAEERPTRPDISLSAAPAPTRLAPHAHAVTAEIGVDPEVGTGRFVVLHDPARPEAWQSDTRVVVYVEADIDPEMATDQLMTDVGWAWLRECLSDAGVGYTALGGTVTAVRSTSYEALSSRGQETSIQVRASWSPTSLTDLPDHFAAWIDLMQTCAGLPPYHPGVHRIGESSL
jgi:hypothetical protein